MTHATLGLILAMAVSPVLRADQIVINFDSFSDSEVITDQIPGLTFVNTIVFTSGISLNEFEFPPYSGSNVASDDGGPITITFSTPVTSVGGFFTYAEPFTLTAFNMSDKLVDSASSAFSNNEAISGDPGSSPNERINVSWAAGISSVTMEADPNGGSFTLDNLYYTSVSTVPEPAYLLLFAGMVLLIVVRQLVGKFNHGTR